MAGMIRKGYFMHIVMGILSAMVSFVGGTAVGVVLGFFIFASYIALMYGEGCVRGEHACSMRDIIAKLEADGKHPDEKMVKENWNTKSALTAAICVAAPFLLLAVANFVFADAGTAEESTLGVVTRFVFLPEAFITRICAESVKFNIDGIKNAVASVVGVFEFGSVNTEALLAMPKVASYANAISLSPLTIMRACFIPASVLPALAMYIGYLQGPKIRKKTLEDMMKGTRKKQRKLRVFNKPRKVRKSGPEI